MEETGLDQPAVVAWSYGTLVIADYIRMFGSDNLAAINLVGSYAGLVPLILPDDPDLLKRFMALRQLQSSESLVDNIEAAHQSVGWLTHKPMDDQTTRNAVHIGLMLPTYARKAMSARQFDNADLLDLMTMPVLITRGEHDPSTPKAGAQSLAEILKSGSVSEYPETGHSPFFESAQRFNEELMGFICDQSNVCSSGQPK